jgi:tetratricopeptide (TPR) repeat protein
VPALRSILLQSFQVLATLLVSASGFGLTDPAVSAAAGAVDLPALVLTAQPGNMPIDHEIARLQERIRRAHERAPLIIQLGWAFVSKARITGDPGYYKIAEQCSQLGGHDSDALLLQGHISHALHHFSAAEATARELTADKIPRWQTYALLGDALMEQGKLVEAVDAYQRMIDIRPCLQTYARVAHLRWLKGDLAGAEELMIEAVEAGSSRDPEPAAWAYTRLALYQFQAGETKAAAWSLERASEFVKDYPAALFLRSKIEIAAGDPAKAMESLRVATDQTPLPEYQWALADAAGLAGNSELAAKTEEVIRQHGASEDPRSFALFLATRRAPGQTALRLAEEELSNRRDVFTYDAVAWAAFAAGETAKAKENIQRALAEGTVDARLFYHAGKIAAAAGEKKSAARWFQRTATVQRMLLPSESADLQHESALVSSSSPSHSFPTTKPQQMASKAANKK